MPAPEWIERQILPLSMKSMLTFSQPVPPPLLLLSLSIYLSLSFFSPSFFLSFRSFVHAFYLSFLFLSLSIILPPTHTHTFPLLLLTQPIHIIDLSLSASPLKRTQASCPHDKQVCTRLLHEMREGAARIAAQNSAKCTELKNDIGNEDRIVVIRVQDVRDNPNGNIIHERKGGEGWAYT